MRYERILQANGIQPVHVNVNDSSFWSTLKSVDYFIFPWSHQNNECQVALSIIPIIEKHLSVTCYPSLSTCWHYDDKIRQYYLLKLHGFPFIESWIFWNRERAQDWLSQAELPLVFKLTGGAGSENITLLETRRDAQRMIDLMFSSGIVSGAIPSRFSYRRLTSAQHSLRKQLGKLRLMASGNWARRFKTAHQGYVLFQRFLPNNEFDTRVTVIGSRAFAFRRHNRPKDFRASGSGRIDWDPEPIDLSCVKLAFEISGKLGFQSMAYDFLFDHDMKPAVAEISYIYKDVAVYNCPGFWDESLAWHEGHYWPQYCQLVDLLGRPELSQPDMQG